MKNLDIKFSNNDRRVSLSNETYEELRSFVIMHGETDLPPIPPQTFDNSELYSGPVLVDLTKKKT